MNPFKKHADEIFHHFRIEFAKAIDNHIMLEKIEKVPFFSKVDKNFDKFKTDGKIEYNLPPGLNKNHEK
jgi:hypothetical protein